MKRILFSSRAKQVGFFKRVLLRGRGCDNLVHISRVAVGQTAEPTQVVRRRQRKSSRMQNETVRMSDKVGSQTTSILRHTESIMRELGIPRRDTWCGLEGHNLDDFHANGQKWNGPRLFEITFSTSQQYAQHTGKKYSIPDFRSVAWDRCRICIPDRLLGRTDVPIHETVHFLQHITLEEDGAYIQYAAEKSNYIAYLSQRCELEAHRAQLFYIATEEPNRLLQMGLDPIQIASILQKGNETPVLKVLIQCAGASII